MTYQEAKEIRATIEANVGQTSAALRSFPKGPMGLTPDAVKASPEYCAAKAAYDAAFNRLRTFNASFVKAFGKGWTPEYVDKILKR